MTDPQVPPADDAAAKAAADAAEAKAKADADAAAAKKAADDANKNDGDDLGYPKNTKIEDMTAEQQAAYWKAYARKHETQFKALAGNDLTPEQVAQLLADKEKAEREAMSAQEKAVADARKEARDEALKEAQTMSVRAIMDAHVAASGLDKSNPDDQDVIDTIQSLDASSFIREGHVDADRLTKALNRIIPTGGGSSPAWPATGQGNRNTGTGSARDAGKAEAARRWPDKVKAE